MSHKVKVGHRVMKRSVLDIFLVDHYWALITQGK